MKKYIFWLIILALCEISLALYLTWWREFFWQSIAEKQSLQFMQQLGVFTAVALTMCGLSGITGYLVSLTAISWREKLNKKALDITNCDLKIENMSQRIQDDCFSYPDLYLNLLFGLGKSLVYITVFSVALLLSFSYYYLLLFITYALVGTWLTKKIASPLIKLNYESQRAEATYRNDLTINNFNDCIRIMLGLAKRQKYLTYFQQFYLQLGVVIPLIVIAPLYFVSGMTLGTLMRFNSVGSTILENTSFGISSFAMINKLIACKKRLKEAQII